MCMFQVCVTCVCVCQVCAKTTDIPSRNPHPTILDVVCVCHVCKSVCVMCVCHVCVCVKCACQECVTGECVRQVCVCVSSVCVQTKDVHSCIRHPTILNVVRVQCSACASRVYVRCSFVWRGLPFTPVRTLNTYSVLGLSRGPQRDHFSFVWRGLPFTPVRIRLKFWGFP